MPTGWLTRHLDPENPAPGFLRQDFAHEVRGEEQAFRIVELAELLYNLQSVEGFDPCIDRMQQGNLEPTYAELEFGRILRQHNVSFRFVEPTHVKGCDFDVEITLPDGVVLCADAKCKIESTEFSANSVRNSLHEARRQFPSNRPSAIFMKLPLHWGRKEGFNNALDLIADEFFKETQRVVSIKFYTSHHFYKGGEINHFESFREISNPRNRFNPLRNWDLFSLETLHRDEHVDWTRLLYFPKKAPGWEKLQNN